ncbi:PAS/PAC sensor signal transduction histidine kinase [Candidatus Magnetoovum chiemensis]|nr:PAS/PAC sensor signal transduction histidine kinase [Candidatus Magnetoovum chiemensis]
MQDAYNYGELDNNYISCTARDILEQVKYMSNTIEDFKKFIKPSKNKIPFKINTAVKETLMLVYKQLVKTGISITLNCCYEGAVKRTNKDAADICVCEPEIVVNGYPSEFKQVILNLISNARDAVLKKKEQGLFKKGEECKISIELSIKNRKAVISIKDNGGGIPDEIKEKIFEPYFTMKIDGMGIGLYMSKTIIESSMAGKLFAENIDNGSKFVIELDMD